MELKELSAAEIRRLDRNDLRQSEETVRRELANMRMDVYGQQTQRTHKRKELRKALARILTIKNEGAAAAARKS